MDSMEQEALGRRAADRLITRLAGRAVGSVDQQGAAPAIVIVGDVHIGGSNILCLGNCESALRDLIAKLTPTPAPAPATAEDPERK